MWRALVAALMMAGLTLAGLTLASPQVRAGEAQGAKMNAHAFAFRSIDGEPLPLAQYKGHPLLVVNTASFCGFTPQYTDLEKLWESYKDKGLIVLGVPSNDFGSQEPGTAAEIKSFCATYDVSFPLTEKQKVVGPDAHPLYRWIAAELGEAGVPRWNFHKYLIDANGALVAAWPSRVKPTDAEVIAAVDQALKR